MIQKEYDEEVGTTEAKLLTSFTLRTLSLRRWLHNPLDRNVSRHDINTVLRLDDVGLLLLHPHDRVDRRRVLGVRLDKALRLTRHADAARLLEGIVVIIQVDRHVLLDR